MSRDLHAACRRRARRAQALAVLACFALSTTAGCFSPARVGSTEVVSRSTAYILADPFPRLVVEVDYVEGRKPSQLALDTLRETLTEVTDKQEILILPPTPIPERPENPDGEDVITLLRETRDHLEGNGAAVLHIVYPNGGYEDDGSAVLGISSIEGIVVFLDATRTGPLASVSALGAEYAERAVLIHELGHSLGLVDVELPMQRPHEDAEHPGHSSNVRSVMYYTVDAYAGVTEALLDNGAVPYRFDEDDLADIRAFRESAKSSHAPGPSHGTGAGTETLGRHAAPRERRIGRPAPDAPRATCARPRLG